MEISVMRCSQKSIGRVELPVRKLGFSSLNQICLKPRRIGFNFTRKWNKQVALRAIRSEIPRSVAAPAEKLRGRKSQVKLDDCFHLFVGLPLDCHDMKNAKAIAVGLKALKLLGVEGVELPVWWGVVEKKGPCIYDWSSYLSLTEIVRDVGLKLQVSIGFHATEDPIVALPDWVSRIGKDNPDIFFTDRSGRRYNKCLSLSVDDLPVLHGRTPLQAYQDFFESFKSSFSHLMGSTITDVTVGLGPNGELRYPSFPLEKNGQQSANVGEFQCYDKHMLEHLRQHADASGQPKWGLSGPHNAPHYKESPTSNAFTKDKGGSWETPYGNFFLSWYSDQLISHGNRLLSCAAAAFNDYSVTVSGKIPLVHSWYKTRSHPSEMTAGFYNTATRDGYEAVAQMFAKNSCRMVVPGMDLSDGSQPGSESSPESLLSQILASCKAHGVRVSGVNSLMSDSPDSSLGKIKERILSPSSGTGSTALASFTYHRMGAYFFSPEHWPLFSDFMRGLGGMEMLLDDLLDEEEEATTVSSLTASSTANDRKLQTV